MNDLLKANLLFILAMIAMCVVVLVGFGSLFILVYTVIKMVTSL